MTPRPTREQDRDGILDHVGLAYLYTVDDIATTEPRFHAKIMDLPRPPFWRTLRRRVWGRICRALLAVLEDEKA